MNVANPSRKRGARVLVTGLSGFTGRHLAAALSERGYEVHGTVAGSQLDGSGGDGFHIADLLDFEALRNVVLTLRPNYVVHLAAVSFVAHGSAREIYLTNIVGTRNLLQALADAKLPHLHKVVLASSANVYGNALIDPIRESHPPKPVNDYAISKLAMEHVASQWHDILPIMIVRPFNYTGVCQSKNFLLPKIVAAFCERAPAIELGNIDVERDFCDVRDVVYAYCELLEKSFDGVLNICSGRARSIEEVIRILANISGHTIEVQTNPAFVRLNEVRRLRGSSERLQSILGHWNPRPLEETLEWMYSSVEKA